MAPKLYSCYIAQTLAGLGSGLSFKLLVAGISCDITIQLTWAIIDNCDGMSQTIAYHQYNLCI